MEFFRAENKYQGMPGGEDNRPDPRRDPAEEMTRMQEERAVRVVLDGLSEKDRLLLSRIYLEEKDKDDVCREFQIDRGYLRVLLHRAIGRCRTALSEAGSGGAGTIQNFRGRQ
jgi:RNA polymerase sigma-70 factor (ECF subfamily)